MVIIEFTAEVMISSLKAQLYYTFTRNFLSKICLTVSNYECREERTYIQYIFKIQNYW